MSVWLVVVSMGLNPTVGADFLPIKTESVVIVEQIIYMWASLFLSCLAGEGWS